MKKVFPFSFLLFFLLISRCSFAQLSVTDCSTLGLTPAQFVQNWLLGSGVTISNAKFNGSSSIINSTQAGSFIATGNALTQMGLDSGMLLTSGEASIAIGPNDNCDAGFGIISPGDTDLTILADTITYDACVLEFDFIPLSDTVRFRYVFGSEEFFNFCHQFNDPFGFFLSGPGISGTFSNSSIDLALMPGSSNYVTINNVCDDPASVWCNGPQVCGPPSMCQNSPPYSGTYYQANALTYVFTAIHAVQACSTYHIKIAIADALDHILDSEVFLEKGSFSSGNNSGPSISGPQEVCPDSAGNVYSTQPGMLNYQWVVSTGGIIIAGGTTVSNTITITWTIPGQQTVSVNFTNPEGCSTYNPAVINVTIDPRPVPVITGPQQLCLDTTTNFYSTQQGMNNYSWMISSGGIITSGGASADNFVNVIWTISGMQTVSVNYSDTNGCQNANPTLYSVNVLPHPVPAIDGPPNCCVFSAVNLYTTQPGMNQYTWNVSSGGIITEGSGTDSVEVTWNVPGQQYLNVNYKDQNGCSSDSSGIIYVTVNPKPDSAGNITGLSQVCTGTNGLVYSVPPIKDASGYNWSFPYGFQPVSGNGSNSVVVDIAIDAGSGLITVSGTNQCGEGVVSPPFPAAVNHAATAFAGPDLLTCSGDPVTVTQASATNYGSLKWTANGTGFITGDTTINPTYFPGPSDTGIIVVTLTATGKVPCPSVTSYLNLAIIQKGKANAGPDINSCSNRPVKLSGSGSSNFGSLLWTSSGSGSFNDKHGINPVYTPGASDVSAGQIVIKLVAYSNSICPPDSDFMILIFDPSPMVTAGADGYICQGMSYTINGVSVNNSATFSWSHNGKGELKDTGTLNPTYYPDPEELGLIQFTLTAFGETVCNDSSVLCHMRIFIYPVPAVDAGKDQSIKLNTSTILSCEPSGGAGNYNFIWTPSSFLIDNLLQNPLTINLSNNTLFSVTITDNITGCTASDSMHVNIENGEGDENCIVIYNVLTPNGDGVNDKWEIDCIEQFPENSVEIFNLWGDRVNSFRNYNNTDVVWTGSNSKGERLPDGTYYYILNIKGQNSLTGWVFLR